MFRVRGMDCADCARHLEKRIGALDGVTDVRVNFTQGTMTLVYGGAAASLIRAIRQAGYSGEEAVSGSSRTALPESFWRGNPKVQPTVWSALLYGLALLCGWLIGNGEESGFGLTTLFYLAAMAVGGWRIAYTGITGLRSRTVGMELLMTVSAIGAALIGQWSEGAAVIVLFSLGEMLEAYTMDRTRRQVNSLMALAPEEAHMVRDGGMETVPVGALLVGDQIRVLPGERIPMDGQVLDGLSAVNQAPITGESVPVDKTTGDTVYAGTVNGEGTLTIEVTRLARDHTLARILALIEEAEAQKAPSQRFVDRFSKIYTPAVLVLALLVAVLPPLVGGAAFEPWFYRALTLLVVACPCALVISTPVAIAAAIAHAARRGVLIKGGAHLERLGGLRAVALDKTGTLTSGVPEVLQVRAAPGSGADEAEVLRTAVAVELGSAHPLARAVLRYAEARGGAAAVSADAGSFRVYPGMGASASAGGRQVYAGSPRLFRERLGVSLEPLAEALAALDREGRPYLLAGTEDAVLGWITFADPVRPASAQALAELDALGVRRLHMLTGDHAGAAEAVVRALGNAGRSLTWEAGLLPEEKLDRIRALRAEHGTVAMVGDGINDAPALAAADLGIAMGAAGSDAALETADVALMRDDLSQLPYAVGLSRRALRIIRQNIGFSLLIKAVFLAAILPGWTTLWLAVLADTGAAVAVTLNGMRLLRRSK
ncbi:heavy metal translocating P-type ATPase [Gorillibacterium sp. sgz5001074]|uniref:heavy metal translocating P-type ATPase n=1 Tax=Gorillibacterium sp. sgz5001074 TaxID=3446695 RepID=UPI003F66AD01